MFIEVLVPGSRTNVFVFPRRGAALIPTWTDYTVIPHVQGQYGPANQAPSSGEEPVNP